MDRYSVIFDFETGGILDCQPNIQLAAIALREPCLTEVDSFQAKIEFNEDECDPIALQINHYDRGVWQREAIPEFNVISDFDYWLRPYRCLTREAKSGSLYQVAILKGYNAASFDFPRLRRAYGKRFLPCDFRVRDVLQQVMEYFDAHPLMPQPADFKQPTIAEYFNIKTEGAHDALADVRLCAGIHRTLRFMNRKEGE